MVILTVLAATVTLLLAAAVTGVFFAFSVSVLPGLDAVGAGQAVASMRSINEKILNPVFLSAFLGVPVAAAATGALLLTQGHRAAGLAFLAAAAVYVLGVIAPTAAVNVPMNETLAALGSPDDAERAARAWVEFSPRWTRWNSLRGAFGGVTLLLAALGVHLWGRAVR
ncbi:anthrone oxygenase family protein [Streptomyces litchfieldiae]|uniref:Anthrone oxygenase family protein n=1 Tax=Streptomyces litchfieldiae TaxID=3075543 RepID=A0ABU2MWF1_9ACTN|nr:anthrone oxygenase family protein [Streptomyces sp. DSM 44938]MDT0345978.1 anthrone oxygenase family protein [Streptomyces sp. DSM 44938]